MSARGGFGTRSSKICGARGGAGRHPQRSKKTGMRSSQDGACRSSVIFHSSNMGKLSCLTHISAKLTKLGQAVLVVRLASQ